jgi:hypothetical protein
MRNYRANRLPVQGLAMPTSLITSSADTCSVRGILRRALSNIVEGVIHETRAHQHRHNQRLLDLCDPRADCAPEPPCRNSDAHIGQRNSNLGVQGPLARGFRSDRVPAVVSLIRHLSRGFWLPVPHVFSILPALARSTQMSLTFVSRSI